MSVIHYFLRRCEIKVRTMIKCSGCGGSELSDQLVHLEYENTHPSEIQDKIDAAVQLLIPQPNVGWHTAGGILTCPICLKGGSNDSIR